MTNRELDELLNSYELTKPITLADVEAIADDLRPRLIMGVTLEVCFTAGTFSPDHVLHVRVGDAATWTYRRDIVAK